MRKATAKKGAARKTTTPTLSQQLQKSIDVAKKKKVANKKAMTTAFTESQTRRDRAAGKGASPALVKDEPVKVVPPTTKTTKGVQVAPEVSEVPLTDLTEIDKARALLLTFLGKGVTYEGLRTSEEKAAKRLDDAITAFEEAQKEYLMLQLLLDAIDSRIEAVVETPAAPAPAAKKATTKKR